MRTAAVAYSWRCFHSCFLIFAQFQAVPGETLEPGQAFKFFRVHRLSVCWDGAAERWFIVEERIRRAWAGDQAQAPDEHEDLRETGHDLLL
jgi:hypothetical protein